MFSLFITVISFIGALFLFVLELFAVIIAAGLLSILIGLLIEFMHLVGSTSSKYTLSIIKKFRGR